MQQLANTWACERARPAAGCNPPAWRCAAVTPHLMLAVVKLARACCAHEDAVSRCLVAIAGVSQVHVDAVRGNVQILYDGEPQTTERIRHCLVVTRADPPRRGHSGRHAR